MIEIPALVKILIRNAVEAWRKGHGVQARTFSQAAIEAWRHETT